MKVSRNIVVLVLILTIPLTHVQYSGGMEATDRNVLDIDSERVFLTTESNYQEIITIDQLNFT